MAGIYGTVHFFMKWGGGGGGRLVGFRGGHEKKMAIEGGPSQKYKGKRGVTRNILVKLLNGIMFSY